MLPQSEVDNYKLQVELLQEKLQRSEISRQQLERKLDKILQKRDEHEKIIRSKARQKYEQFLEEQQRRNERNKQLVQMLERIEQQTEIMNARSERLKTMKLQYEMYFAKLVHTQTKRCLQNSVQPVTHFVATSSTQPVWTAGQQSALSSHNYVTNTEAMTALGTNDVLSFAAMQGNLTMQSSDIPTLAKFIRKDDPTSITVAPTIPLQQLYQYNIKTEAVKNVADIPANCAFNKNGEVSDNNTSYIKLNANMMNPSVVYLSNDKKLPESNENPNLLTTTSSTFEEKTNVAMMPQQEKHALNSSTVDQSWNSSQVINEVPLPFINGDINAVGCLQNTNDINNKFNTKSQDARNEIQSLKTIELNNNDDIKMPNPYQKPSTSLELEKPNTVAETIPSSSKNKSHLKKQSMSIEQIENEMVINKSETNSSVAPVSIENIENEIYGELLTPLETEEVKSQETSNAVPKLLENIVQSEPIENISTAKPQVIQEAIEEFNTLPAANNTEQNLNLHKDEQNTPNEESNSDQQSEESSKNITDYSNYENVDSAEINESQQQYDYKNYDPKKYAFPGYEYDETTGEYKPDSNVLLNQYGTDQQYPSEVNEKQYQQQDYDYNQTNTDEATRLPTTEVNTVNNDNDTTQTEALSTVAPTVRDKTEKQPEPVSPQTAVAPIKNSSSAVRKVLRPTSILSSTDKNESQKKKKRVNFIKSSKTNESSVAANKRSASSPKPVNANTVVSSESDFDFSSSTEAEAKTT